jgi:DNA-binding protein Fis
VQFDVRTAVRELLLQDSTEIYRQVTDEVDRIILEEVMQSVSGNQVQACKRLGIARMTLRNKLRSLNMLENGGGEGNETA